MTSECVECVVCGEEIPENVEHEHLLVELSSVVNAIRELAERWEPKSTVLEVADYINNRFRE